MNSLIDNEELFLLLYEDLEIPKSTVNNYLDALVTNIILKKLNADDRKTLYQLLSLNDTQSAILLINQKIPDFKEIVTKELKIVLENISII